LEEFYCHRPGFRPVADRFEAGSKLVVDLGANWSATCYSKLDSVMEFGYKC